jgi:hypothetical protein
VAWRNPDIDALLTAALITRVEAPEMALARPSTDTDRASGELAPRAVLERLPEPWTFADRTRK